MAFSTTGSIIPEVSDTYALTLARVSYLPLSQFGGGFAGLAVLVFLMMRGRAKPGTLLSAATLTMSVSSLVLAALKGFSPAMLAAYFIMGGAMSFIFAFTGALVSRASGEESARNLNVLYAFMSGGVVLSPLVHGALVSLGARYNAVFFLIGGISLGLGTFTLLVRFPSIDLGGGPSTARAASPAARYRTFIAGASAPDCSTGGESLTVSSRSSPCPHPRCSCSGMIPIIFSFTEHLPGGLSSVVFVLVLAVGMLGATLMNRSVGFISGAVSFRAAMAAGALPVLALLALTPVMKRTLSRLGGNGG